MDIQTITNMFGLLCIAFALVVGDLFVWGWYKKLTKPIRKRLALWIWRNLSGGKEPFYHARKLARHQTYLEPPAHLWFGWKLRIWNRAVHYLICSGALTHTPTLREKF